MQKAITWVESHPQEDLLAIGRGEEVILWDLREGVALRTLVHEDWVTNVRWSPDGTLLVAVSSACFDRSGSRVYTAHFGGMVKVWDLSQLYGEEVASLTFE